MPPQVTSQGRQAGPLLHGQDENSIVPFESQGQLTVGLQHPGVVSHGGLGP